MGTNGDQEDLPEGELTELLRAARRGNEAANSRVFRLVEDDLRKRARKLLSRGRPDAMVDTTGLLHTVFLRLMGSQDATWEDSSHFFRHAAQIMRRILVDLYRKSQTQIRGGGLTRSPQDPDELWKEPPATNLVDLNEALEKLAESDPTKSEIVNLHFFSRLTLAETADVLGISESSVAYQWRFTRAWLRKELGSDGFD